MTSVLPDSTARHSLRAAIGSVFLGAAILFAAYEMGLLVRNVIIPIVQIEMTIRHIDHQLKQMNHK